MICPLTESKAYNFLLGKLTPDNSPNKKLRAFEKPEPFSQSLESRSKWSISSVSALSAEGCAGSAIGEAELEAIAGGGAGAVAGAVAGAAGAVAGAAGAAGRAFGATAGGTSVAAAPSKDKLFANEAGVPSDDG